MVTQDRRCNVGLRGSSKLQLCPLLHLPGLESCSCFTGTTQVVLSNGVPKVGVGLELVAQSVSFLVQDIDYC